jgi:hypothetical protein
MICGSDGILAKPTNDNGKIANGSPTRHHGCHTAERSMLCACVLRVDEKGNEMEPLVRL